MALNALGLPVQLQASPLQLQDLLGGMKAGDVVKGRILELLPDGKAVLNLKGQNVVAQLPDGAQVQKGDVLALQVTQLSEASAGKAANLVLRLLPTPAGNASTALAPLPGQNLPPQALIDQSIAAARVPNNTVSQQVARTLLQAGVPLTPQALASAVRAVESLLANGASNQAQAPTPSLPAPILAAVQDAVTQLQIAVQLDPNSQTALAVKQAVRELQSLLTPQTPSANATANASAAANAAPTTAPPAPNGPSAPPTVQVPAGNVAAAPTGTTAPTVQARTGLPPAAAQTVPAQAAPNGQPAPANLPGTSQAPAAPASTPAPAPHTTIAVVLDPPQVVQSLSRAVAQVVADPSPANLQALQNVIAGIREGLNAASAAPTTVPASTPTPAPPAPASTPLAQAAQPQTPVTSAPSADALPTAPPSQGLVQRETLVQLLAGTAGQNEPGAPVQIQAQAQQLAVQLQDPQSQPAQRLVAAIQAQYPEAAPAWILETAVQTLQTAQSAIQALPSQPQPSQAPTLTQVTQAFQDAGLAVPKVDLNSLPVETVAEAVAWLQARDLPPQRPLVEAVAVFLQQDHNALPAAQRALDRLSALPAPVLDSSPALKSAYQGLQSALSHADLDPALPGLAARLQSWASDQGLTLESRLALPSLDSALGGGAVPAGPDKPGLRPALQNLENQLKAELKDPAQRQPEVASTLQSALRDVQTANHSLNAIPLQAQAAPAFDTVHMPLPVAFAADLGGQLSITWRQGRDRVLNEKDPVSVAVALNTGELGTVKVLLQVWKDAATARVLAQDPATAQFLSEGADELREGFAERTPFKLQALDFATDQPRAKGAGDALPEARPGGLSLSA